MSSGSGNQTGTSPLHLAGVGFPCRITGQPLLPSLKELFGPAVIQPLSDAFLTAKLSNRIFAPKPGKDNPYLFFRRIALACLASDVLDRAFCGTLLAFRFLSHRSLLNGDDEPRTLPYANPSSCSMGADAGHTLMNPNTLTAPLFRARADRDLTRKLYRAAPVLIRERPGHPDGDENPWGFSFQTKMYDLADASGYFRTAGQLSTQGFRRDRADWRHEDGRAYVPLYEAKMIHHYDHRFGSYTGLNSRPGEGSLPETPDSAKASPDYESDPWYWVPEDETSLRVARVPSRLKQNFPQRECGRMLKGAGGVGAGYAGTRRP